MIFVTVGTQLPFDRLIGAVDSWVEETGRTDVFAQIANPGPDGYRPQHFDYTAHVSPAEFKQRCQEAECIVAHAGMGSIITAMTYAKPLVIMPRRAHLAEHRNDHQYATVKQFGGQPGIHVADDADALSQTLNAFFTDVPSNRSATPIPSAAEHRLIDAVRSAMAQL